MEEERLLAAQHQLALQAQVNEGQAHIKVCIILFYLSGTTVKLKDHRNTFIPQVLCVCAKII